MFSESELFINFNTNKLPTILFPSKIELLRVNDLINLVSSSINYAYKITEDSTSKFSTIFSITKLSTLKKIDWLLILKSKCMLDSTHFLKKKWELKALMLLKFIISYYYPNCIIMWQE